MCSKQTLSKKWAANTSARKKFLHNLIFFSWWVSSIRAILDQPLSMWTFKSHISLFKTCQSFDFPSYLQQNLVPLLPPTKHTINPNMLDQLKPGVILVNSSRGGLVDTNAVLRGIQDGIISGYGADVYENEGDYFFQDWSGKSVRDPTLVVSGPV